MSFSQTAGVRAGRTRLRAATTAALFAGALATAAVVITEQPLCRAQSQSLATSQRVVQGKVLVADAPVTGAIVYLKNSKTLEVRTYISTADGSYRFGQLGLDSGYTLWAEYGGKKSKERAISSFDSKRVFDVVLKVESK